MSATNIPAGCTWKEDPDKRTLRHVMTCEVCSTLWPLIAQEMRKATGKALPTDDPRYISQNVGYKDK
jgi:hypothetical protein